MRSAIANLVRIVDNERKLGVEVGVSKQVVVIGAGISGLTAAYALMRGGRNVTVLEASTRVGGCIHTECTQGFMLEYGPNSMLVNRQGVLDLIDELGLGAEVVTASATANKRFIVKGGRLHALPASLFSFLTTPLFSAGDKLRLLREPFIGRGPERETIADFAKRRLGEGFYDYAINPFVSGVYAGDPDQLLARAAIRKVWELEHRHGSMVRGALAMITGRDRPAGRIKGRLLSFREGMAALPKGLAKALGERLRLDCPVARIERCDGGWRIHLADSQLEAGHVVLAIPAVAAASLLMPHAPAAAEALRAIPYAPVAIVHLGFRRDQVDHALDGFGGLIPRKEGLQTLGILFSSSLFPGRSKDVLLTCFIGGATRPEVRERSHDDLREQVLREARQLLGLRGEPNFAEVHLWQQAIPQYTLGHFERLAAIDRDVAALVGLTLRANWRDGISVPDCILNGFQGSSL